MRAHTRPKRKLDYSTQLIKSARLPRRVTIAATWVNSQGNQCKKIIQLNRCFCSHSFEQHCFTDSLVPYCGISGCKCRCYEYVPYYDIKCMCRHSYKDHDRNSRMCKMCKKCLGFLTNWACKCGFSFGQHDTVMEKAKKEHKQPSQTLDVHQTCQSAKENQPPRSTYKRQQESHLHYEENKMSNRLCIPMIGQSNENKTNQDRRHLIDRINKKFAIISMENQPQPQKGQNLSQVRLTTPLQLILQPHQYRGVKVSQIVNICGKNASWMG